MLQRALIPVNPRDSIRTRRLKSCVRLVADEAAPVALYVNHQWSVLHVLKGLGLPDDCPVGVWKQHLPDDIWLKLNVDPGVKYSDLKAQKRLIALDYKSWSDLSCDKESKKYRVVDDEFVVSEDVTVNRALLEDRALGANTSILLLASIGLDILLPNISFENLSSSEIENIKEILAEERNLYLAAITKIAKDAHEQISTDGISEDIVRWAKNEMTFSLAPAAREIEVATSKVPNKILKDAGFSFWKDGVPAIASSFFTSGLTAGSITVGQQLLKSINIASAELANPSVAPEISYALALRGQLEPE